MRQDLHLLLGDREKVITRIDGALCIESAMAPESDARPESGQKNQDECNNCHGFKKAGLPHC